MNRVATMYYASSNTMFFRERVVTVQLKQIAISPRAVSPVRDIQEQIDIIELQNIQNLEFRFIERIGGLGVFAKRDFVPGEMVVRGINVRLAPEKSIQSITGPEGLDSIYNRFAETVNHHCDPNTGPVSKFGEPWNWYARTPIRRGDEITWAYDWTEPVIGHFNSRSEIPAQCMCGGEQCRSPLEGFLKLSQIQQALIARQKSDLDAAIANFRQLAV